MEANFEEIGGKRGKKRRGNRKNSSATSESLLKT